MASTAVADVRNTRATAVLAAALAATLAIVLTPADHVRCDQGNKNVKDEEEVVLVGPFLLGDLYAQMDDKELLTNIPEGGGPSNKAIIRTLNKCKVYIIDKRKRPTQKGGKAFLSDSRPKVVLEGKLSFTLEDKKGKLFKIHVMEAKMGGSTNWRLFDRSIRCRGANIFIRLGTSPYRFSEDVLALDLGFHSEALFWEASGKVSKTRPSLK
jgi:hypothetical protein